MTMPEKKQAIPKAPEAVWFARILRSGQEHRKRHLTAQTLGVLALGSLALLAGCHVGPRYTPPAAPAVTAPNSKESPVNFQDTQGWKVASPQDAMIRGNWWETFNEPELNALEEQLNLNNQNLKQYFENYMAARATIAEARSEERRVGKECSS